MEPVTVLQVVAILFCAGIIIKTLSRDETEDRDAEILSVLSTFLPMRTGASAASTIAWFAYPLFFALVRVLRPERGR